MLLLTISVIVLIGTMAMSLAVINFKMKKTHSSFKQCFYLAEAGIDESFIMTIDFVDKAVNYALSKVDEFDEIEEPVNSILDYSILSLENELIEERRNIVFIKAFKNFIKGNCTDISPNHSLITELKNNESYVVYNNGYPKIYPEITENTDYFLIEVKSTYMEGYLKEELTLKYKIFIPNYNDYIENTDLKPVDIIRIIEWKKER